MNNDLIQLQPRDEEYMGILQEECAEVIQIISKINRFGLYASNPFIEGAKNNQALLIDEVGDVYAMILKLEERGLFRREQIEARAAYKHEKLKRYLRTEE